ncbi:hypothetical protein CL689_06975 [Candidatus Saccharibacteria bacterium]|nr:hypothetical protein [Candidatus Saccharibacteria bacterium]
MALVSFSSKNLVLGLSSIGLSAFIDLPPFTMKLTEFQPALPEAHHLLAERIGTQSGYLSTDF